ncbi:MAG: PhzF family phenazine biosynthesis protein [Nitrospinae bacterium]|nr:PhzF family phenazine biosynthesis protein [Nitrospinota bacterium]
MEYKFYQVDVFTSTPLGGNPLAVFVEADGLDTETLQKVAREMNLSETTFVLSASDADFEVRIFTPEKELPFAGHPTIGTAHILRQIGKIPDEQNLIRLKMKVGVIPVHVEANGERLFMEHPQPEFGPILDSVADAAHALGLPSSAIDTRWPCQVVSTGFPALFVPLTTLDSARNIKVNIGKLEEVLEALGTDMVYVFTLETVHSGFTLHSRAFAPGIGIPEDPATGSASGAMGAYAAEYDVIAKEKLRDIKIEQGYEMGRPSSIYVEVEQAGGEIKSIRVGGESVTVVEGQLKLQT